jgi:hypothetical protein
MTKIDTEKCIISIIWSISGIHSLHALTKGKKYNSECFCQHVIPDIQQNICSSSRRKTLKRILFSCILRMHELAIHVFLQKRLNLQKPKECRIHLIAQTRASINWLLPLCLFERKTIILRDIVHSERRSNLCDTVNFLWNSGTGMEKCVHKLDHEILLGYEEEWRMLHQIIKEESNYRYPLTNYNVSQELSDVPREKEAW